MTGVRILALLALLVAVGALAPLLPTIGSNALDIVSDSDQDDFNAIHAGD